jgi:methionyl-tRNA synthetase
MLLKRYLVTSALPYANGPLHFGHLAGVYIPADIYTRHLKLMGEKVIHICGSDEHGVAIMQNAQLKKIPYQDYVNFWHEDQKKFFADFQVEFDFFGQTSSEYHKEEVLKWFHVLHEKKAFEKRSEDQLKCGDCHQFLPDRFVEGECYSCGHGQARGDECPSCGIWIDPLKLKNPVCKFCGSKSITVQSSVQWYLTLSKFTALFHQWFQQKSHWKNTVFPYIESLVKESLHDRAMTRDLDWGIPVPLPEADGKRFYVWFDAPIGYVSNTKEYLKQSGSEEDYQKDWWLNPETKIVNFVGKDNIIFHGVIFPSMCLISAQALPVTELPANQYLNLFGDKISKSKGNVVDVATTLEKFGVEALRYYLISIIPEQADTNFNWSGLEAKVNNELANNVGNLFSRCLKFMEKNFPQGFSPDELLSFYETQEFSALEKSCQEFRHSIDAFEFRKAQEILMQIGTQANLFFSDAAPWSQIKTDELAAKKTIAYTLNYLMTMAVLFAPMVPSLSEKMCSYFSVLNTATNQSLLYKGHWQEWKKSVESSGLVTLLRAVEVLVPKIDSKDIKDLEAKFTNG